MARQTIRRGSKGQDVEDWQLLMKVKVDGDFGPTTELATVNWQRSKKLVPDGVVGPVSWATAEGKPVPETKTASAPADQEAYETAKRAASAMPESHRQYVLAVARGEGFYGRGWGNVAMSYQDTQTEAQKHGLTGKEGVGSNNWGATQGKGDAGSFPHIDHHADGSTYVGQYKRWSTPELGFLDIARVILGGGKRGAVGAAEIKRAIEAGDLEAAVKAQHANGYFELAPSKYLEAVRRNYGILTANLGWQRLLGAGAALGGIGGAGLAVVGGLVVGGLLWWARSKG